MLQQDRPAPLFTLPDADNTPVSLLAMRPRTVVLYFYPKDNTAACTTEALAFSAALEDFARLDAVVIGISRDSVVRHRNFARKHDLSVTLLSDEDGSVCDAYGVWVEKSMYGRRFMGIERSTFLIDGDGILRQSWRRVRVAGHVDEVLHALSRS
jgi:peroxiredoxin Q/BCP